MSSTDDQGPEPENPEVKDGDVAADPATPPEDEAPDTEDSSSTPASTDDDEEPGQMPDHDTEVGA